MLLYCLKCRKNTQSKNQKVVRDKNGRMMFLSKCAVCDSKKSKFFKKQEASGFLSCLGIKAILNQIPLLDLFFFCFKSIQHFLPELHRRQPRFTYSACGPFHKNKERIKKN